MTISTAPRRTVLAALRVALPLGLLALLWHLADGPAVLARLGRAEWPWLLAALAAAHAQILLSALRWQMVAARLGQSLSVRRVIGEYYLAQLINQTLPGGVLGDAARAVRARHEADLARSGQAVVIERMAGQIALALVTAAGFGLAAVRPGGLALPPGLGWQLAGALGAVGLALLAFRLALPRAGRGFAAATRTALLARAVWPRQLALGLAIVGCNLATFALCARATGTTLSPEAVLTLIPLILTAMLIPLSIAGWGFREGAAAALLPLAGASPEAAIAASLAFGAVILLSALPGAIRLASA